MIDLLRKSRLPISRALCQKVDLHRTGVTTHINLSLVGKKVNMERFYMVSEIENDGMLNVKIEMFGKNWYLWPYL